MGLKKNKKRPLARPGRILAGLALFLLVMPFFVPVTRPDPEALPVPFRNSRQYHIHGTLFHTRLYKPQNEIRGKIVLIHGFGGSTYSFQNMASLLMEEDYLVLLLDLPGFGYSERNLQYDHSQANRAGDVRQILQRIDDALPKDAGQMSWHAAGHSMGGGTVAALATAYEEEIASLFLLAPDLKESNERSRILYKIPPIQRWMEGLGEQFFLSHTGVRHFLRSAYGQEPTPEQVAGYLAPLRIPGTARAILGMPATAGNQNPQQLATIRTPIHALWGRRDTWVALAELDDLRAIRPDTTFTVLEDAGHCPMETHTLLCAQVYLSWLQSLQ